MDVPDEFRRLVRRMHRDFDRDLARDEDPATALAGGLDVDDSATVLAFLRDLLARDNADLRRVWRACDPEWGFRSGKALRQFLTAIRDHLEARPQALAVGCRTLDGGQT
jgi:hypothetical protein